MQRDEKRRGGSGAKRIVPSQPHVPSGPDPSVPFAAKSPGRPCVPGKHFEEPGTSGGPSAKTDRKYGQAASREPDSVTSWVKGRFGVRSIILATPWKLSTQTFKQSLAEFVQQSNSPPTSAGGRLFKDFRPRRASLGSYSRREPTRPKQPPPATISDDPHLP